MGDLSCRMSASLVVLCPEGATPTVHLRLETQQSQHIELRIALAPSRAPRAEVSPRAVPSAAPAHRDSLDGQGRGLEGARAQTNASIPSHSQDFLGVEHPGIAHVVDLAALNLRHYGDSVWSAVIGWGAGPVPHLYSVALFDTMTNSVPKFVPRTTQSSLPPLVFAASKLPEAQEQIALSWSNEPLCVVPSIKISQQSNILAGRPQEPKMVPSVRAPVMPQRLPVASVPVVKPLSCAYGHTAAAQRAISLAVHARLQLYAPLKPRPSSKGVPRGRRPALAKTIQKPFLVDPHRTQAIAPPAVPQTRSPTIDASDSFNLLDVVNGLNDDSEFDLLAELINDANC